MTGKLLSAEELEEFRLHATVAQQRLLGHIAALEAENERLRGERDAAYADAENAEDIQRKVWAEEYDKIKAENERLREAIRTYLTLTDEDEEGSPNRIRAWAELHRLAWHGLEPREEAAPE